VGNTSFRVLVLLLSAFSIAASAQVDPQLYSGLDWRLIGPFRAGRTVAVTGVPGQPETFYFGAVVGGVWRTSNAGRTWTPIFDQVKVGSIGAVAVSPSDANVIYVGSGEADMRSDISEGNGISRSTDGGKTWTDIGLHDTQAIGRVLVDPHDPNRVFVAALGHPYGPNAERGVFRSTDGGRTWQKVLYNDENTGAIDLAFDPRDSSIIYAAMWSTRRPPWNVYPPSNGPGSGLYKSTDGGNHWQPLANGLPTDRVGRIGVAVAPSDPNRVYALVDAKNGGVYRSDDAGTTWRLADNDARIWGRGWYFGGIAVDPKNPDVLYVMNTSTYRSMNGGKTFDAIKGAPGGDDYHQLWIYPDDPARMVLASDQGAIVTVDGAKTWSSWYNQPTAQLYHVTADNRFPYWVYGAQQDSGAVGVASRSNSGNISFRDWVGVCGGGESGYVVADPLHPGEIFGGTVSRCNVLTNLNRNVDPELGYSQFGPFRRTWTLPLAFSAADPRDLYFGSQYVFKTSSGGESWQMVSPDLTRENPGAPPNLDPVTATHGVTGPRRGVVYAIAPSPLKKDDVWIGTDDGLIQATHDGGKSWQNVTPAQLTPWSKVGILDASHFDANTVFAAVDRHRLDDKRPYIYRTHDGGKTWQLIVNGLPDNWWVNTVREDPVRKGLLFAGTESGVYVSFDEGDYWQSLQLNLPASSMRDFALHGGDLIVGTHGRSIWILDGIAALRQIEPQMASEPAHLFRPDPAIRMRPGSSNGTPLPPDVAFASNPSDGALIDYYLKSAPQGPVTLEVLDATGNIVRRYSSTDESRPIDASRLNIPAYWVKAPPVLSAKPGMHRWVWDLHYPAPSGGRGRGAGFGGGGGIWALPGQYTVRLTADGTSYTQPLPVKMDPRLQVSMADLQKQFDTARQVAALSAQVSQAVGQATALRGGIARLMSQASMPAPARSALQGLSRNLDDAAGVQPAPNPDDSGVAPPSNDHSSLLYLGGVFQRISQSVNGGDAAPTDGALRALHDAQPTLAAAMSKWEEIKSTDLAQVNAVLKEYSLPPLALDARRE
jgi:photosystem II stability/assembly factor-like uncharacterized protein